MQNKNTQIILFDGVCNLCNGFVQFIIKNDPNAKFKFASLQSVSGQLLLKKFGLPTNNFDSLVYLNGHNYFLKSSAIIHVLRDLRGIWKLFYVFIIIPKFIRDFFYNIISKTRYQLFGKLNDCKVPSAEIRQRFLE